MTNSINVPRELLADLLSNDREKRIMAERNLYGILANAPSPAGVDGLKVVAWQHWGDRTKLLCALGKERGIPGSYTDEFTQPLCRLSDAQTIIDGLRGENERIRLNIAEYNEAIACYQSERDRQAQRIGEMEGLLREVRLPDDIGRMDIWTRIDAALAEPPQAHSGS